MSLGYQQIVGLAASTALTVPAGTTSAIIIATGQAVAWRDDGVAPTATVGMPMPVNTPLNYIGNVHSLRFIQVTTTATLNITYY